MNARISALILAEMATGATLDAAIGTVLGAGTYARIAGDVYATLRGEA